MAEKSAGGPPPSQYATNTGGVTMQKTEAQKIGQVMGLADEPKAMVKEDAVKGMAPQQMGGMIGGVGQKAAMDMIGKPIMVENAPTKIAVTGAGPFGPIGNAGEAAQMKVKELQMKADEIAKKVGNDSPDAQRALAEVMKAKKEVESAKGVPDVKKVVDSFGKPEGSMVEQRKMEAMKQMGVPPPKDAKDMEDLRKGIYRPDGKEIPGTGMVESLQKDFISMLSAVMKLGDKLMGKHSGYTSGEMFGSTNTLILIALVVAIVLASKR